MIGAKRRNSFTIRQRLKNFDIVSVFWSRVTCPQPAANLHDLHADDLCANRISLHLSARCTGNSQSCACSRSPNCADRIGRFQHGALRRSPRTAPLAGGAVKPETDPGGPMAHRCRLSAVCQMERLRAAEHSNPISRSKAAALGPVSVDYARGLQCHSEPQCAIPLPRSSLDPVHGRL